MPAQRRSGRVTSAAAPRISQIPVMKITCDGNGTQDGVIASSFSGAHRCADRPPPHKTRARIQRIAARPLSFSGSDIIAAP